MARRTAVAVIGWLLAAVAATVTGLAAVQVIGAGLTGPAGEVRSADEVARALTAPAPSGPATVTPSGPATMEPSGSTVRPPGVSPTATSSSALASRRVLSTPGGTVVAQCDGGNVLLISWTPAQGYRVREVDQGPDDKAELTFAGSGSKIEAEVRCLAGEPVSSWREDDD